MDYLIGNSGGNPRELLRLLDYCFQFEDSEIFTKDSAEKAVQALATDYRRILDADDYRLLHRIDCEDEANVNSERSRTLLFNLALLEYNSFWWKSHPVIRTLPAYQKCADEHDG